MGRQAGRTWETPTVERFGTVTGLTRFQEGGDNKLFGFKDMAPFNQSLNQCPEPHYPCPEGGVTAS